jgi:Spy/CpxP family protein refolding chaperone
MKKLIVMALLAATSSIIAQDHPKKDGAKFMENKIEKLTQELSLTTEQQEKLKTYFEQRHAMKKDLKSDGEMSKEEKMAIAKETDAEFKSILTPEQYEKWKSDRKENRGEMKMDKLTQELSLTTEQQVKLKALFEEKQQMRKESNEASKAEKMKMAKETNQKVKAILTPEQYEKWQAMKKDKKEEMKDKRKEMKK